MWLEDKKFGLKFVSPPKRWRGFNRDLQKAVWLCGLSMALDGRIIDKGISLFGMDSSSKNNFRRNILDY